MAKKLIVVGDRVLIAPEEGAERTKVGLYLPPTAVDNQQVQGGRIMATGPGLPMPDPGDPTDEPWRTGPRETRFLPMQARVGDYALFFAVRRSRSPSRPSATSSFRKPRSLRSCATPARISMSTPNP